MTFFTGAMLLIVFGSITMWILSYVMDEIEAMRGTTWQEVVVMLIVCFAIGSAVS